MHKRGQHSLDGNTNWRGMDVLRSVEADCRCLTGRGSGRVSVGCLMHVLNDALLLRNVMLTKDKQ